MAWINAVVQGLLLGGSYALLACGLSLMFGVMKIVNLAHGALAVAAAYLAMTLLNHTGLPAFATLIVVVPVFAVVGYALQRGLFNRALKFGEPSPLLVSFGLAVIVANGLQQIYSADSQAIKIGRLATSSIHLGGDVSAGAEVGLTDIAGADVAAGGAAGTLLAGNSPEGREVGAGVNGGGLDDAADRDGAGGTDLE